MNVTSIDERALSRLKFEIREIFGSLSHVYRLAQAGEFDEVRTELVRLCVCDINEEQILTAFHEGLRAINRLEKRALTIRRKKNLLFDWERQITAKQSTVKS